MVLKKVDNRIRVAIENGVQQKHRTLFFVVGDKCRDQVVILHHMLSKAQVKSRPSVLWCYKKELGFSSHRKKRMKQLQKKVKSGSLDLNKDDPFELFIAATTIRYCYYGETHKVLGSTYGMLILQDFEALQPNLLARTIETIEGGGLVCVLLRSLNSLKQLYTMTMDVHARYRTESHNEVVGRFNERFILSLSSCRNCLVIDDQLRILPISAHAQNITAVTPKSKEELMTKEEIELKEVKESLQDTQPVGSIVNQCRTLDQAKAVLKFIEVISEKTLRSTVALTAARGRGKSAAIGLALASAVAFGYSNIFVTSPDPENLKTLFEFVFKGFDALDFQEHIDYEIIQSTNPDFNKAVVRVNVFRDHRQTIQYISPTDHHKLGQAELLAIDEAAAIPLPYVKELLGPYLVFMSSTINGYEGTGRSLSLKLIENLRQCSVNADKTALTNGTSESPSSRVLVELALNESIRYSVGDPVEIWLNKLLCLDATVVPRISSGCPMPDTCDLYYINRDTLFSYHKASEMFLQRIMSLYVASHYKDKSSSKTMQNLRYIDTQKCQECAKNIYVTTCDQCNRSVCKVCCPSVFRQRRKCKKYKKPLTSTVFLESLRRKSISIKLAADEIVHEDEEDEENELMNEKLELKRKLNKEISKKNSPNDLQLMSDAPAHHLFCLLGPVDPDQATLPEVLCVIQVCLEGEISKDVMANSLARGKRGAGDLIPWTISQQYNDSEFGSLSGARIVRIATHPDFQKMGYGKRALEQLISYYSGSIPSLNENDSDEDSKENNVEEDVDANLLKETVKPRKNLPPMLLKLSERRAEKLDYIGVSYGLTADLLRFWKKSSFVPVYLRQSQNDLTGEHTCIMLKLLNEEMESADKPSWLYQYWTDFQRRFISLLSYDFKKFDASLGLGMLQMKHMKHESEKLSSKEEITYNFTNYDLKRLEMYSRNMADYHLILDLLPNVARLYYSSKLDFKLSLAQNVILLGLGLQRKSVDIMEKEIQLPSSQILGLFNKIIRKSVQTFNGVLEAEIEKQLLPQSNVVMEPVVESLKKELADASKEFEEKTKQQKLKVKDIDLSQYSITGSTEEWDAALGKTKKLSSVSISSTKEKLEKRKSKVDIDTEEPETHLKKKKKKHKHPKQKTASA